MWHLIKTRRLELSDWMIIQVYCFSPKPGKLHLRAAGKTSVHAQNSAPPGADKHRRRYIITENVIHRPRNKYFLFLAGYMFPTAYHSPSCLCFSSVFPAQRPTIFWCHCWHHTGTCCLPQLQTARYSAKARSSAKGNKQGDYTWIHTKDPCLFPDRESGTQLPTPKQ